MNSNANTNAANITSVNAVNPLDLSLPYEEALLSNKEKAIIESRWDGEAVLKDGKLPDEAEVAVHDGDFHADEVLSLVLLHLFGGFDLEQRARTRDEAKLATYDLRVDVGYGLLDHHKGRAEVGVAACSRVFVLLRNSGCFKELSEHTLENLAQLVSEVAATDTGVSEPNWISRMVQTFNSYANATNKWMFDEAVKAVNQAVGYLLTIWEAEARAEAAAMTAIKASNEGPIVVFPEEARAAQCKELLYAHAPNAIYYISPEIRGGVATEWRVLCAADPAQEFSFKSSRRLIPEKFRSLDKEELDRATGLTGGVFSHQAGFIAGFKTREAAEAFARLCLAS